MKLSEVYSAFNDLDDVIDELEGMSNHCEARSVFNVSIDRSHVDSMLSKSKKHKKH